MKNHHLFASGGIGLALVILAVAAFTLSFVLERPTPKDRTEEAVALVLQFGAELKNVALLAQEQQVEGEFEEHYRSLVAPELLQAWKADPQSAPGRLVSSPAPERIDISSVARTQSGGYQIEAVVIETAQGREVSRYPASITVDERAGMLMITSFQKGAYEEVPAQLSVEGVYVCLAHRGNPEVTTMECAFGLTADDGRSYALDMSLLSSTDWTQLEAGTRIKAQGPYLPDDGTSRYEIEGVINATSIAPAN